LDASTHMPAPSDQWTVHELLVESRNLCTIPEREKIMMEKKRQK
jgi:hypothetical protein